MQNATVSIAAHAIFYWARGLFTPKISRWAAVTNACVLTVCALTVCALTACSTPQAPLPKAVYDSSALESTQVLYRLAYADAQQLRPYAQARWSMPPAQLLRLRLRDALSTRGTVLGSSDTAAWVLKVELDEFSQLFDSATTSSAVVRLQASLHQGGNLVAQRSLLARAPAPSADAPGGVRALTIATDDAVQQLTGWVAQQVR
jgi:cholesterol transport system auxiliary component